MPKRPSLNAGFVDKPKPYLDRLPDALLTAFSTNDRINRYLIDSLPPEAWKEKPSDAKGRAIAASPFPPPGLAGQSQHSVHISEASREGSLGSFRWNPLNPNSQHYTVSISCRDGLFIEKWEVTRVNGILRSRITIEHGAQWSKNNPTTEPVIFRYSDPEFVKTSLATEMPESIVASVVHPGWKPRHRFEVPAAILAPNGSIQVVLGVKLPDGSTLTDFGSWNILTKHFGDTRDSSRQP